VFWWRARLRWRWLLAMASLVRAERKSTEDPPGPTPSCGAPSRGAPTGPKPSCGAGRVAVGPKLKRLAAKGLAAAKGPGATEAEAKARARACERAVPSKSILLALKFIAKKKKKQQPPPRRAGAALGKVGRHEPED